MLRGAGGHGAAFPTMKRKNNKVCSTPGVSPPIASRIQQKSLEKSQQEDYADCANTSEYNLHHVAVVSTDLAKVQFKLVAVISGLI
jgi:hypothetical protein